MLATLVASVVSGEAADAVTRARRAAVVFLVAGILGACGVGFLISAGYIALSREVGSLAAALWFSGGFLLAALIILLIHRIGAGMRARKAARRRSSEMKAVASAAAFAALPTLLAGRGKVALLVLPALAALAYGIWRENAPRDPRDSPLDR